MNAIYSFNNPFLIIKIFFLVADSFYIFFLFVLLNRIFSMERIIKEEHDEVILRTVAIVKIFLAISLFLLALAVL